MSRITVLPVTRGWILRANLKNHRFARNEGLDFTGKFK
ncbi:vitamin B12-binding protein, partial [Ligilactobacillus ruminis]